MLPSVSIDPPLGSINGDTVITITFNFSMIGFMEPILWTNCLFMGVLGIEVPASQTNVVSGGGDDANWTQRFSCVSPPVNKPDHVPMKVEYFVYNQSITENIPVDFHFYGNSTMFLNQLDLSANFLQLHSKLATHPSRCVHWDGIA